MRANPSFGGSAVPSIQFYPHVWEEHGVKSLSLQLPAPLIPSQPSSLPDSPSHLQQGQATKSAPGSFQGPS